MDSEDYWIVIFSLKDSQGKIKFPNLVKVISLLFSLPVSNATAERLFSVLKNIKTAKRNRRKDLTVISLIKIKDFIKSKGQAVHEIMFEDELIHYVMRVKANATIQSWTFFLLSFFMLLFTFFLNIVT